MKKSNVFLLSVLIILISVFSVAVPCTDDDAEEVKTKAIAVQENQVAQNDMVTAGVNPKVLILLGEWFGDAYFPLKDRLEALGWEYYRVGVDETYRGCYNKKRDVELKSDLLIPELKDLSQYDALIIPSGPQFRKFITNDTVMEFVRRAYDSGLVVASFCTGDMVVSKAGLYEGKPEWQMGIFPEKITVVKDRLIIGPRGGGPPPGDGYKSVPYDDILKAIADELARVKK